MTGPAEPAAVVSPAPTGLLVAGAWLGPALALSAGALLLQLARAAEGGQMPLAVAALASLAGLPAALWATLQGAVAQATGMGAAAAAALAALAAFLGLGLPPQEALAAALAAAGCAASWVGIAIAARLGLAAAPALAAGALLALAAAGAVGGSLGALGGLGLGATAAGLALAAPGMLAPPATGGSVAMAMLSGLGLALGGAAAPLGFWLAAGPPGLAAAVLGGLVALPGLAFVALDRGADPWRLARRLLGLQALLAGLVLVVLTAPAAEAALRGVAAPAPLRMAVLGAGFLPACAVLLAALLRRGAAGRAALAAVPLSLPALAPLLPPPAAAALPLAGPLLATALAFRMLLADTTSTAEAAREAEP